MVIAQMNENRVNNLWTINTGFSMVAGCNCNICPGSSAGEWLGRIYRRHRKQAHKLIFSQTGLTRLVWEDNWRFQGKTRRGLPVQRLVAVQRVLSKPTPLWITSSRFYRRLLSQRKCRNWRPFAKISLALSRLQTHSEITKGSLAIEHGCVCLPLSLPHFEVFPFQKSCL